MLEPPKEKYLRYASANGGIILVKGKAGKPFTARRDRQRHPTLVLPHAASAGNPGGDLLSARSTASAILSAARFSAFRRQYRVTESGDAPEI
jgi:hypothetical protein